MSKNGHPASRPDDESLLLDSSHYLQEALGDVLAEGLSRVARTRPPDPIEYLAGYLRSVSRDQKYDSQALESYHKLIADGSSLSTDGGQQTEDGPPAAAAGAATVQQELKAFQEEEDASETLGEDPGSTDNSAARRALVEEDPSDQRPPNHHVKSETLYRTVHTPRWSKGQQKKNPSKRPPAVPQEPVPQPQPLQRPPQQPRMSRDRTTRKKLPETIDGSLSVGGQQTDDGPPAAASVAATVQQELQALEEEEDTSETLGEDPGSTDNSTAGRALVKEYQRDQQPPNHHVKSETVYRTVHTPRWPQRQQKQNPSKHPPGAPQEPIPQPQPLQRPPQQPCMSRDRTKKSPEIGQPSLRFDNSKRVPRKPTRHSSNAGNSRHQASSSSSSIPRRRYRSLSFSRRDDSPTKGGDLRRQHQGLSSRYTEDISGNSSGDSSELAFKIRTTTTRPSRVTTFSRALPTVAMSPVEYKKRRGFRLPPMAAVNSNTSSGSSVASSSHFSKSDPSSLNSNGIGPGGRRGQNWVPAGRGRPQPPRQLEPLLKSSSMATFDSKRHHRKNQKILEELRNR